MPVVTGWPKLWGTRAATRTIKSEIAKIAGLTPVLVFADSNPIGKVNRHLSTSN